ncbi:MAG: PASTA domain-containing protein [Oscillospiraceae bacterium]|nr:PASTA domain-containing protein [Oscillospiraceae bacterium]
METNNWKRKPGIGMLRRTMFLMATCGIAAFAVLIARLYHLQITEHEKYESLAVAQQLREAASSPERGAIYDRNGVPLAISASVDNVYLSPVEIEMYGEDKDLIADGLSQILGIDRNEIYEKASRQGSWYVTAARKIERETADRIRAFKEEYGIKGVRLETDTKRYYPNASLACHLIGFVGTDNYGLEGIEAQYNAYLEGGSGASVRGTNAYGAEPMFGNYASYIAGSEGCDVITTIDSTIQYYIEKHLRQAVVDYDALNGAGAIAMDVNTGAVLAMASLDGYDPNDFLAVSEQARSTIEAAPNEAEAAKLLASFQARQWRNKALSDTYEPGSTFKIITLSMALDSGAVSLGDRFYCPGYASVIGRSSPIRCWKDGGHGSQTLTQAVQHSCNAAFVAIGQRVGAERFYEYCDAFGFLNLSEDPDENLSARTGIDLAGESGSIWWSRNTFCSPKNLSQLAAASFGQTFTITPLQLITAVSACVNGGKLMRPYVVAEIKNAEGEQVFRREPEIVRQVIRAETSEKVRSILEQVVGDPNEGTGRNASVAGYRIGGKTGTSEKVSLEAATGEKEYIVSFIGFAPADDPQIAVLVFLDTPSNKTGIYISGGQMAAPVVGAMMADILPYLGVRAEQDSSDSSNKDVIMPQTVGKSLDEAAAILRKAGLRFRTIGEGETVTAQLPAALWQIAKNTETILYLGAEISPEKESVPNLAGMRYNDARDMLSRYGIYLHSLSTVIDGDRQCVSTQNIPSGAAVEHGSVIEVSLVSNDDSMLGKY